MNVDTEYSQEQRLWQRFVELRSNEDRESLIEYYIPLAKRIARHYHADRQVSEIEFAEFFQYALVGLLEAVDRFDTGHGVTFATFASHRIRGAILSGVEKHCERQQQITARARMRQERLVGMLKEATAAKPKQDTFAQLVDVAIGVAIGHMLENTTLYREGEQGYDHNVYRSQEISDLARVLDALVGTLPDQERRVIYYHYYQHIRFDLIAETMGLSKGRVAQIHHRSLLRMREHYDQLRLLRTDY